MFLDKLRSSRKHLSKQTLLSDQSRNFLHAMSGASYVLIGTCCCFKVPSKIQTKRDLHKDFLSGDVTDEVAFRLEIFFAGGRQHRNHHLTCGHCGVLVCDDSFLFNSRIVQECSPGYVLWGKRSMHWTSSSFHRCLQDLEQLGDTLRDQEASWT